MTPTRNSRWSVPVTMCFAPRYMNGAGAGPSTPCTNAAFCVSIGWPAAASGSTSGASRSTTATVRRMDRLMA